MRRVVTAKIYSNFVRVSYFEDFEVKKYEDIKCSGADKFEKLENAIKKFVDKNNIKIYKLSFNMDDDECILQNVKIPEGELDNYINTIRFQFPDFISDDEVDEYVFDYQVFKREDSSLDVYSVAAPKEVVEEYIMVGIRLGKRIDLLRPVSSSIGCALARSGLDRTIVVDISPDETIVRVYKGKKLLATNVGIEGAKECIEILKENSYLKTVDFKNKLGRLLTTIIKTISYYDENRITKQDYNVLLIGEGAKLPQIKKTLEGVCTHKIISPEDYIKGKCSADEAPLIFGEYGLLF